MITITEMFNNDRFLKYIKLNHEIKAVYIGGSRMFNLDNEDSDYDINILVADVYFKDLFDRLNVPILYAKQENISIHWYYVSYEFRINNQYSNYIYDIWMCQLYYGLKNKNNIIKIYDEEYFNQYLQYINDNYKKHILNVKHMYSNLINRFIYEEDYLKIINNIDKIIYFLCLLGYLCSNTKINKEMLLEIKKYAKRNYLRFSFDTINILDDNMINMIKEAKTILIMLSNYLKDIEEE